MGKDRKPLGTLAVVALAAILLSAFALAVDVDAAKGGKGKGGGANGSTATMAVSPNPVPLGSTSVVISGSGFGANQNIWINTGFIPSPTATTDGSGSFSLTYYHEFNMAETASMLAWSSGRNPQLLATATYTVQ